jgi:hypothetical protein
MNGFLVIARCLADDIPLRLCAARADAWEFARGVDKVGVLEAASIVNNVSVSEVVGVQVVEFVDGVPMPAECVPFLDDGPLGMGWLDA